MDVIAIQQAVATARRKLLPAQTGGPNSGSEVVDRPSGVLEGAYFFQYGNSRGSTGNSNRVHYDRLRGRINPGNYANFCVAGFCAADAATFAYGSATRPRQGNAVDASVVTTAVGSWSNLPLLGAVALLWPFGNDALFDGSASLSSTTVKARAAAANALHALVCLFRAETRVEQGFLLTGTVTNGSPNITATTASKWYRGMLITGTGVPANTYVGTILSPTSFKMSSSRTAQIDVNGTSTATSSIAYTTARTGSWTAVSANTGFSGANAAIGTANASTSTWGLWLDEARRVQWVTAGVDDANFAAPLTAGGAPYSISIDGGAAITGTTSNQHRTTAVGGGLQLGLGHGQMVVDLGVLAAGAHSIAITQTGAGNLTDDCLLVESLTPPTVLIMKEVELPSGYYNSATGLANGASFAKTQIYNAIVDTERAKWPNDDSVLTLDISANSVNGSYDKAVHISNFDGTWAHFNDQGERLVTDKIMGVLNKLSYRPGLNKG